MQTTKRPKNYNKRIYNVGSIKNKDIKEIIEKRYTIFIIVIIALMSLLIGNLFVLQVVKHSYYLDLVHKLSQNYVTSTSTPRGRIYDRNGNIIVDNEAVKVIFYKKQNITTQEEISLAYKVSAMIELSGKASDVQLRTFYAKLYPDIVKQSITLEEWKQVEERKLTTEQIEKYKLERITEEQLESLTLEDLKAAYLYALMNTGYSYDEKIIKKQNVTDEEYAKIAENVGSLQGFDVRLDWKRVYPYGDTLKTILGTVSTTETGIPYELKDYYLNLGYSLNDRVGTSYLEYQYESLLKGQKTVYQVLEDGSYKVVDPGSRGYDIVLSIDIELQKALEEILTEEVKLAKTEPNTKYYNRSFAIISDPVTGEILAMAGKQIQGDKIYDYTPGIVTTPVVVGSVVKGASHIVGYNNGALTIGEKRSDECIKIKDTPKKCSWTSLGVVDDLTALKYSSNVFQFKTAMKVGGGNYIYDHALNIDPNAFQIYRDTFAQFGLGVLTGIDLPIESLGYKGNSTLPGHLLDFAIGQYDTYTPIQLSQYINTIASGGYRLQPHLLKAVYRPGKEGLTDLLYEVSPTVLNKVTTSDTYMKRVQEGFREVMTSSGTGASYINSIYKAAGKTGTSESFLDSDGDGVVDKETTSNAFVAYAPFDNPQVSFVVVSPDVYYNEGTSVKTAVNRRIAYKISQKYFELYK